ncbi:MAG: 1,4-dihydroxy-2-naphthoate octaprenyltransferase [Bacteroidota bacterium]
MKRLSIWIQTARPRTLPLSVSGIITGLALSPNSGFNNPWIMLGCIVTTILFQVLSNFANDLGDGMKGTDNAKRIGPERSIQSGKISVPSMKNAVNLLSFLSLLSAGLLLTAALPNLTTKALIFYLVLALLCVLAAITYTVGKKAYGYHGGGDLMVFLFFGGVAVLGTRHLFTSNFSLEEILAATAIGAWSTMVLNLNNLRDLQNDKASGKNTIAVILGGIRGKWYHYSLYVLSSLCWILLLIITAKNTDNFYVLIAGIPLLFFTLHLLKVYKIQHSQEYDPELKKIALSTFAAAMLFFLFSMN